jgi:hypothetical membrane protein
MRSETAQTRPAATLAIFCFVWWTANVILLPLLRNDGYDPVEQAISELALGRFGTLMDVAFFVLGIGGLALASGLYRSVSGASAPSLLLGVAGLLWFLLGIFQTGPDGLATGAEAVLHGAIASTSFLLIVVAMFLFVRRFQGDPEWRLFALPTLVWAIAAVAAFLSIPLLGQEAFGVSERLFVAVWLSWLLVTAVRLRSLTA